MKDKTRNIALIGIIVVLIVGVILANVMKPKNVEKNDKKFRILTSFYPVYIMTLNIANGASNVEVENMAENLQGCIHNYTLSTSDLKKFEDCDVFIENGAGLEEFTDEITSKYSDVKIIEAADLVNNFLVNDEGESNSHIWLSIDIYITEVNQIAKELSDINPENKEIYEKNCNDYVKKLMDLKSKYEELKLENMKVVCLNESLQYLLNDNSLDVSMVETDHEQSSISAKTVKDLIDKIKNENIKAIFIDKDDNRKDAEMISKETGAGIYVLNSEMNGSKDTSAYLKAMEENLRVFNQL